ncbi:cytochrome P450 9e2-like [Choristoneura fumiferana]|uniref:cytochrome P450 9e2-like n=1 Tax=Choristoneura fumiferana TaxID=7141 RepID=UPI003D15F011
MIFYIWVAALVAAFVIYCRQVYSRFSKYGVKNRTPIPLVGNMATTMLRLRHFVDIINNMYTDYPEERFVGNYEFVKPVIFIRDIELIKKITVKDFEHFLDHRTFVSEELDPLFGRNLFSLKGQEWKDMRSTLSPAFTSSKMKHMLPFIVEVGNQMVNSLKTKILKSKSKSIEIDVKDLSTRFANDVIASCAFGLRVDSHTDDNNEFYKMGYKASNFGFWQLMKFFLYASVPSLAKKMKMTLFSDDVADFFKHLVTSTMKDREAHNILRPDMIHLLMEAKKGRLTHDERSDKDADAGFATVEESTVGKKTTNRTWSDIDLVAQAALFFIAGFETVSTAMTFLLYELAVNPDVQEKLAQEISEHEKTSGGKFDYNSIQSMTYMDMCVSELLRLWPPAVASDRLCNKDYNLGKPNAKATEDYIMKKGEGLNIPVMAIHRDPEFFPDPLKFDPERFSDERKHEILPFTYLPFGLGPRNCIGSRFALCEVKVMVYQLLQHMKVEPSERTHIPIQLSTESFNLRMKGGHWLQLRARN